MGVVVRLTISGEAAQLFLHPSRVSGPPGSHGCPFRPLPGPEDSCEAYRHVLGQDKLSYEVPRFHGDEERFFVEGLSFPDAGFTGLISFHVTLLDDSNEVGGGQGREGTAGVKDPRPLDRPAGASPESKKQAAGSRPSVVLEPPRPLDSEVSALPTPVFPRRISLNPRSSLTPWCSVWRPGL